MLKNVQNKDYSLYSFEEFLQDDFFISSIKNPTEETNSFWNRFKDTEPKNIDEFLSAQQYINSLCIHTNHLPEGEISNLWGNIQNKNDKNRKSKRRLLRISIGVAASLIIFVMSLPFIRPKAENDIASYAQSFRPELSNSSETRLFLSEDNIVLLDEKEAIITYDANEIRTAMGAVSKNESSAFNQLITPNGKRSVLTFSDGTKIWANAGSRIVYPVEFQKNKREIYVDGEIYIEVEKDENRPFFVKTKDMNVRVLGTKFNVTAYESDATQSVVLVSGSVQVSTEQVQGTMLVPNQMFKYAGGNESVVSVNVDKYTSWVKGLYVFESESLKNIFDRLSRYYGVEIDCDLATSQMKCSGKLDLKDNIDDILRGLSFSVPITYQKDDNIYRISKIYKTER